MMKHRQVIHLISILCIIVSLGNYANRAYAAEINVTGTTGQITENQLDKNSDINGTIDPLEIGDKVVGELSEVQEDGTSKDQQATEEQEVTDDQKQTEDQEITDVVDQKKEYAGKIILDVKKVSIKQGEDYILEASLTENNLSDEKVRYYSGDKKIITVSQKGVIKAVHWGEATVTVTLGEAKAVCKVTVTKDVQILISAAGDVTLSSDIKQSASVNFFSVYNKQKNNAYFFKNVKSIFEKDDMTIVNFEGTLSNRGSRVEKQWAFRGKPSYIDILKKGSIEAVAFANNHVKDYGQISYTDTINSFKKANIVYSSYSEIGIYEVKGIKIGMISIQETSVAKVDYVATLRKALKTMKEKKPDLLIVSFHWGIERTSNATKAQTDLSRIAIDEGGADLVLGHHPHVLQPIEKYKNAYIVYSLGNFCFGGNTNPPDKDTMIYQQTFTFHNDKLVPDDKIRIIPCSVSSISTSNNYQPMPSVGSEKTRILKRLNSYSKQYRITFNKSGTLIKKTVTQ
ncbi:MAG: lipoprotein [Herbinix sp.]|jgi:poly-gamma-glutamate synthesis protein (capsule biosynthesis protein)|nr:lipoprotein [Herbinix sp.]